jgi:hypothetical protein
MTGYRIVASAAHDSSMLHFERASLEGAQLSGADLRYADFADARLDHANLIGAKLGDATLVGASVFGAHLARAQGPVQLTAEQEQQVHCLPERAHCDAAIPRGHVCERYE